MAGYEYDSDGQSVFFILTFLVCVLVPWTYLTFKKDGAHGGGKAPPPCEGWGRKHPDVKRGKGAGSTFKLRHLFLAAGWALLASTVYQASAWRSSSSVYDPFSILGISTSASEKQIKKHYRKLSLKFHPDKLQLAENQTKEDADAHFVDLTKAYKTLTDETVRRNFELYGHPDGKQEFGAGIAIPKWVVDSSNNLYVLGIYALLFGIAMPYFVGRWWFRTRRRTKDGVLNDTASLFFHELKEDVSRFGQVIEILSGAIEYKESTAATGQNAVREFDKLEKEVKDQLKLRSERLEGKLYRQAHCKRAAVLLYSHLFRLPISDVSLLKERQSAILTAVHLTNSLGNIALASHWLPAYTLVVGLQQHLVQALHPTMSPLLQLPHISAATAQSLQQSKDISTVDALIALPEAARRAALPDLSDSEYAEVVKIGKHWPQLEVLDASFSVTGERIVTPGCIVQLAVKVKISPPRSPDDHLSNGDAAPAAPQHHEFEKAAGRGKEMDLDELLGRRKYGSDGEEANAFAHAPHFPANRRPAWSVFVGDHRVQRIFVQPQRFADIGPTRVRTIRLSFQAPPHPGLYTFQTYIRSETYVGCDAQVAMRMQVETLEALGAEAKVVEDDISEPDEDSIAGQMAVLRGQPVRRIADDEDDEDEDGSEDDTSGSESGFEWTETTASEDED